MRLEQLPSDLVLEATLLVSDIPHSLPGHQVDIMLEAFSKAGATLRSVVRQLGEGGLTFDCGSGLCYGMHTRRISHTEYLAAFVNDILLHTSPALCVCFM